MKSKLAILLFCSLITSTALAQFTGPEIMGTEHTVEQISDMRLGSYVTVTGHVISHQRGAYFTFRDDTGTIRVEIEGPVWRNRLVSPDTKVRLLGEIDHGSAGRYLWVKSLEVIE